MDAQELTPVSGPERTAPLDPVLEQPASRRRDAVSQRASVTQGARETRGGDGADPRSGGGGRGRVLIVEDYQEMRSLLTDILSPRYRVTEAADGRAGFERAVAELPDVIITDLVMPEWSGHEMVEALRREPRTRAIPVILLTAEDGEQIGAPPHCSADDYIAKPFLVEELLEHVEAQLGASGGREARASRDPQDPSRT